VLECSGDGGIAPNDPRVVAWLASARSSDACGSATLTHAPVADLPVRKGLGGRHFVADLTLPGGHVLVDYMKS